MTNATLKRVARRALERAGRDVTLRNYSKTGEDDYGENYSSSTQTVTARVVRSSVANPQRDAFGADTDADAEIYVSDQINGITDGGGDGASEVDVDGQTYVVVQLDDQDNGQYCLLCVRAA